MEMSGQLLAPITLKWVTEKQVVNVRTWIRWLNRRSNGRFLWTRWWTLGFTKSRVYVCQFGKYELLREGPAPCIVLFPLSSRWTMTIQEHNHASRYRAVEGNTLRSLNLTSAYGTRSRRQSSSCGVTSSKP